MLGLLPPSSRVSFFRLLAPAACDDQLAHLGRPGEGHLVHVVVRGQRGARGLAEARHHVDHAVRHPGLGDQLGQPQRGQRGLLGRLEDHAVTGGQGGAELPRGHQQREVPRDDLPHDAERLAQRVGVEVGPGHVGHRDVDRVALDLGGPAGHVVEQVRGQRHVRGLGHGERLAVVQRLELGELVLVLEDEVTDAPDDPAPVRRGHPAPRAGLEGRAGRADGPVDVLRVSFGDPGQGLAGRRVGRLEGPARRRVHPLPVDEQLPRGRDELLDVAVQGYSHDAPSPLPARPRQPPHCSQPSDTARGPQPAGPARSVVTMRQQGAGQAQGGGVASTA